jgi:hypothetical protein
MTRHGDHAKGHSGQGHRGQDVNSLAAHCRWLRLTGIRDITAVMIDALLHALAVLGLMTGVTHSSIIYAVTSATHVLGIALLLGPIALVDLRLLGLLRRLDLAALAILRHAATLGVLLLVVTGVLLFAAKPVEYAANPAMQIKLLVIAAGLGNALGFEWQARRVGLALAISGRSATLAGGASLILWLSALLLGRWIAFV